MKKISNIIIVAVSAYSRFPVPRKRAHLAVQVLQQQQLPQTVQNHHFQFQKSLKPTKGTAI